MKSFLRRGGVPALAASIAATLAFSATALAAPTTGTDLPTTSPAYNAAWQSASTYAPGYTINSNDNLGVGSGKIGHVWVIVLENHAETASFTPLEGTQGTYLSQLPKQGAFLPNYYGTGHSSQDNYLSMVSGQAPISDTQDDCPSYNMMSGSIDTTGTPASNSDYGQFASNAGADAPPNDNGCVYPSSVSTIFNQLTAAQKSWKVYAQDVDVTNTTNMAQDAGIADCGAPDATVGSTPVAGTGANYTPNNGTANPRSQYVAKHNPLAWFSSLLPASMGGTGGNTCAQHLAPMFGSSDALYSDLQSTSSTPDLSYIVPNNCSDGHDSVCKGNNLSGETAGFPAYNTSTPEPTPTNYTGGTAAESNFLGVVVPEIEASPAFKQDGMIVVTYDESYPAFTNSGDSQANSQLTKPDAYGSLAGDAAGETLYGRSVAWEPTGPNATIVTNPNTGQVLTAGPGDSAYIDRPTASGPDAAAGALKACTEPALDATDTYNNGGPSGDGTITGFGGSDAWVPFTAPTVSGTTVSGSCIPGFQAGGYSTTSVSGVSITAQSTIPDTAATMALDGDKVTFTAGGQTVSDPNSGTDDGNVYVGSVQTSALDPSTDTGAVTTSTGLPLVNSLGNPVTVTYTGAVALAPASASTDPYYNAFDATLGGGDTGAVVISPDITPGTVSNTDYNHYSLLRTLEDILVPTATNGVGGTPYLGFAAQPGLAPFGSDVFTAATQPATTTTVTTPVTTTVTTPSPSVTVSKTVTSVSTITTPGGIQTQTTTKTVTYVLVPGMKGYTEAEAKKLLRKAHLRLGKVKKPKGKLKKGEEWVISSVSPGESDRARTGTKVEITLKAVETAKVASMSKKR